MWRRLILIYLVSPAFTGAEAPTRAIDPKIVSEKMRGAGLKVDSKKCLPVSFIEGGGRQLSFMEVSFRCGDLSLQLEVSRPVQAGVVAQQVQSEVAKVHEVYGASKNPYVGYVSRTAQCPEKNNLRQEKMGSQPFLIGRLNERGVWGACGKGESDFWGAITFVSRADVLAKVRILAKKAMPQTQFHRETVSLVHALSGDTK